MEDYDLGSAASLDITTVNIKYNFKWAFVFFIWDSTLIDYADVYKSYTVDTRLKNTRTT